MTLLEQINADLITAMKAKDADKTMVYRNITAAIKNKMIDQRDKEFTDADIQAVISTLVKQLKDANTDFETGGRDDLIEKNNAEIAIMEAYLPAQLPDDELRTIVSTALENAGVTSKADMGKAMGAAVAAVAGRADGNRVKDAVLSLLT